jgi:hypothetical protein
MAEWNIAAPALTHPNIVAQMRAAPSLGEWDEAAAVARINRVAFLRSIHAKAANGDPGAQALVNDPAVQSEVAAHNARVATYAVVKAPKPPPVPAPLPPVTATVPQAPRAVVPAAPQPTPAFAAITNRTAQRAGLSQAATVLGALWNVKTPFTAIDNTQT